MSDLGEIVMVDACELADLAEQQLRIREAKGSLGRRRAPAHSPAPMAPSSSSFSAIQGFGSNGVVGAQQQQPSQPSFLAGSEGSFNFTTSTGTGTGTNPFNSSGPSNPFARQSSATAFGQPASAAGQQGSVFAPSASQLASNPFTATGSFSFGQPQSQTASIFSKSTPASNSFTFGGASSFSSAGPTFGVPTQKAAGDNDETMDITGDSPRKVQTTSVAIPQQEHKSTTGIFGASTPFSLHPDSKSTPANHTPKTSQPFAQFLQQNQSSTQQSSGLASSGSFQPLESISNGATATQPSQPSLPSFNFFPKSTEAGKGVSTKSTAPSTTSVLNPFLAAKEPQNGQVDDARSTGIFNFGPGPGIGQGQSQQNAVPNDKVQASDESSESKSASALFQSAPPAKPSPFNPSHPSKIAEPEKSRSPTAPNDLQPLNSIEPRKAQAVFKVNPFQDPKAPGAEKPADQGVESFFANPLFQASNAFGAPKPADQAQGSTVANADFSMSKPSSTDETTKQSTGSPAANTVFQNPETGRLGKSVEQPAQGSAANPFLQASQSGATQSANVFQASKRKADESGFNSVLSTKHPLGGSIKPQTKAIKATHGDQAGSSPPEQSSALASTVPINGYVDSARTSETPLKSWDTRPGEQASELDTPSLFKTPSQTSDLFSKSLQHASAARKPTDKLPSKEQAQSNFGLHTSSALVPAEKDGDVAVASAPATVEPKTVKFKVKSHGPSNIPKNLDSENYVDYDKIYRLRSLNARFKEQIATIGPSSNDIEVAIRFYASQRTAIGFPIGGLYHRVKAGDKRKTQSQNQDEASGPVKRARVGPAAPISEQEPGSSISLTRSATGSSPNPSSAFSSMDPGERSASTAAQPTIASDSLDITNSTMSSNNEPQTATQGILSPLSSSKSALAPSQLSSAMPQVPSSFGFASSPLTANKQPAVQAGANGVRNASAVPHNLSNPNSAADSTLKVPNFGSPNGTDFMAAFAAKAKQHAVKMEAENKAKRKAEEFDSEEEDEAEYDRRAAEEVRARRAKIQNDVKSASGFTPVLSSASSAVSASPGPDQGEASTGEASAEASETSGSRTDSRSDGEEYEDPNDPDFVGQQDGQSEDDENSEVVEEVDQEGEESGEDDDIQTAMAKSYSRGKEAGASAPEGRSLFDRISKPDDGSGNSGSKVDGSQGTRPTNDPRLSAPPGSGLFGSRPSTPNLDSPTPLGSGILSTPPASMAGADNTWKPGSTIKFGSPSAPAFSITPATPLGMSKESSRKSLQGNFFGADAPASTASNHDGHDGTSHASSHVFGSGGSSNQSGAGFGAQPPQPQNKLFGEDPKKTIVNQSSAGKVGFAFGAPEKSGVSPLLAPSNASSAITSRNTSPGLTDHESAAESGPDDQANEPQSDLMSSRPGEEDEEVVFQVRTKVLEPMTTGDLAAAGSKETAGYKTRGLGPLRVLKNSETGRTRIVMRSDPASNVIINSPLIPNNNYDVQPSGKEGASVKLGIYQNGNVKGWVLKIKNIQTARDLVDHLKKNEPNPVRDKA